MRPTRLAAFSARATLVSALLLIRSSSSFGADGATPASAPLAQPTPGQIQAARDLFAAASMDEQAFRWSEALEKLRRVAEVKLTAGVRYHIAFCEEKLGQTATALEHYAEARDAATRERNRDVLALLADPFLANLRARVPTLRIDVPSGAAGATVTVDDHPHPPGLWGVAVPLDPGTHRIQGNAPGRLPFSRELILHEREVTVLDVVLPPTPAPPAAAPIATADVARTAAPSPAPGPTSPARRRSLLPAALATGGAVVLVGAGVAAYLVADAADSTARAQCLTRPSCDDLKTPVRTWDAVALGAWIGGAALATAAIVLWAMPRTSSSADRSAWVTVGPGQLRLEGSF